jgi:hypothetical protein
MIEAYADATARPFGYLVVDLHQLTDDRVRFRSNIFSEEGECGGLLVTCYHV